jgi:hypothetical protein
MPLSWTKDKYHGDNMAGVANVAVGLVRRRGCLPARDRRRGNGGESRKCELRGKRPICGRNAESGKLGEWNIAAAVK